MTIQCAGAGRDNLYLNLFTAATVQLWSRGRGGQGWGALWSSSGPPKPPKQVAVSKTLKYGSSGGATEQGPRGPEEGTQAAVQTKAVELAALEGWADRGEGKAGKAVGARGKHTRKGPGSSISQAGGGARLACQGHVTPCRERGTRKLEKCVHTRLSTRAEHSCRRDVQLRILCLFPWEKNISCTQGCFSDSTKGTDPGTKWILS